MAGGSNIYTIPAGTTITVDQSISEAYFLGSSYSVTTMGTTDRWYIGSDDTIEKTYVALTSPGQVKYYKEPTGGTQYTAWAHNVNSSASDRNYQFAMLWLVVATDGYSVAYAGINNVNRDILGVKDPATGKFGYVAGTYTTTYTTRIYLPPAGIKQHLSDSIELRAFSSDPYSPGGMSEPGGGPVETTPGNEDTDIPTYTPTQQAERMYGLYGGMLKAYNMDQTALSGFYGYMWTDPSIWSVVSKIFVDPMQAIVGLLALPIDPADITSSAENITIANVDTGVSSARISNQYVDVDCGTVTITPRWNGYLDYSPYTRISLFLPYIGFVTLSPEDVMGKDVQVLYSVDVLTGGCLCRIRVTQTDEDDSYTQDLYQFSGNCGAQIPYCSQNYANLVSSALQAATTVVSTVATVAATGGITAPFAVAASASLASSAANMQMHVQRSGAVNGSLGFMGVQNPYLVITRPRQCLPANQNEYIGYPSYITETLGDLTGFTAVEQIHIEGLTATDEELTEIEQLLKTGVIL